MNQLQNKSSIYLPIILFILATTAVTKRYEQLTALFTGQVPDDVHWLSYYEIDYSFIIFLCILFGWITLKIYYKRMNKKYI